MSTDPEYDRVATLEAQPNGHEYVPPEPSQVVELPPPPIEAPPQLGPAPVPVAARPARRRPGWVLLAAIAAVGLIASGTLGYFFYSTNQKLEATTQALASTKLQVGNLKTDAAGKKQVADYMTMYTVDSGRVRTDYQQVVACTTFSTCRTAAQQTLADMQAFQSDRQSARVPSELSASDSQLGDSLSAGIAAVQELIAGMDNDDIKKVDSGFKHLDDAMLGIAKAESTLGAELK